MRIYAPSDTNSLHIERISDTAHSTLTSMILDTHQHYFDTLGWVDVCSECSGGCGGTRINMPLTAAQMLGRSRVEEKGKGIVARQTRRVVQVRLGPWTYLCHLLHPRVLPLSFRPK
jgi:hypothetical protein